MEKVTGNVLPLQYLMIFIINLFAHLHKKRIGRTVNSKADERLLTAATVNIPCTRVKIYSTASLLHVYHLT